MSVSNRTTSKSFGDWVVKRGVLYALIQTPLLALFLGYFYRVIAFPTANAFTVMVAFAVLPVWILYRKSVSDDPDEPVHHLHKYALWALVPYVVYNFARVPMHYLLNIVFWDHWYDFGSELTGQPVDQWSSLIPGTFLHSLQGYCLALGFYVLFKRHSLTNAMAYVFLFLSVIYTWTFPTFVLVDFAPPPKWFFVVWWAHFWMALAAWWVPRKLYGGPGLLHRVHGLAKATLISLIVIAYVFPVSFVFWRVATWQFAFQHGIDQKTFDQAKLVRHERPVLMSVHHEPAVNEAHYQFTLRFGPRPYKDYIQATKALDAGPILVKGRVTHEGAVVAQCWHYVDAIETPNNIIRPGTYFPTLKRMQFTDIEVECIGPAGLAARVQQTPHLLKVRWSADVTLVGDRETEARAYEGT